MKFSINVGILKQALGEVSKGLGNNKQLEFSSSILITAVDKTITLVATDGIVRVEKTVECFDTEVGTELVNAEMFMGVVAQLNSYEICNISTKAQMLHIKSKGVSVKQKCLKAESFPQNQEIIDLLGEVTLNQTEFANAVSKALVCVSREDSRPLLRGINVAYNNGECVVASCDGYKIAKIKVTAVCNGDTASENFNVTIPTKALSIIQSICSAENEITLSFDKSKIEARTETLKITSSLIADKYFDYAKIIPSYSKFIVTCDTAELKQALSLSLAVSKSTSVNTFKISIEDSNNEYISILSNAEVAEGNAEVNAKFNTNVDNYTMALNTNYVLDILKTIKDEKIQLLFNEANTPFVVCGEIDKKYLFLVLPVRTA